MAIDIRPAWQQVLLVALNNVPKGKDGRGAWDKLNAEEQSAAMEFLAEHVGEENADTALDETCAMIRRRRLPRWLLVVFAVIFWLIVWQAVNYMILVFPAKVVWSVNPGYIVLLLFTLIHRDRDRQLERLWFEREQNLKGPRTVLEQMHNVARMSRWQAFDKGYLIPTGIYIAVHIMFSIVINGLKEGAV